MRQSRAMSALEALLSTAAGFGVALLCQWLFLPYFGGYLSFGQNVGFACLMTIVSLARQYSLRRFFEAIGIRIPMSAGAIAVLAERRRQVETEGFDEHHDDAKLGAGELAAAGAAYAALAYAQCVVNDPPKTTIKELVHLIWPWHQPAMKIKEFRRNLVRSGALILAEIERFDRNRKRTT